MSSTLDGSVIKRELGDVSEYGDYYSYGVVCGNCGTHQNAYIKKGTPATGRIECNRCGCGITLKPYGHLWAP